MRSGPAPITLPVSESSFAFSRLLPFSSNARMMFTLGSFFCSSSSGAL